MDRTPLVELRSVTKVYHEGETERPVLRGIDVSVTRGEFLALLGRSGSGKSTLLNVVSGIDAPTAGEVWVDGTAMARLSDAERTRFRRHHIGFVFQFFNLIPTLTVVENLLLPLEMIGRTGAVARADAEALLAEVGLADRGRAFPDRLSGGEQQRVAVARALVHDPELILADEPTGNLDAETAAVVLDLLDRLVRELGKTVVMATHSREVIGVADRVFAIQHGRLLEQDGIPRT